MINLNDCNSINYKIKLEFRSILYTTNIVLLKIKNDTYY